MPTKIESYWVLTRVVLNNPIRSDTGDTVSGYYLNLGVLSAPGELKEVVSRAIGDGTVDWSKTEWEAVDRREVDDVDIRSCTDFAVTHGVWYRSGRILVP